MLKTAKIIVLALLYSAIAIADDDDEGWHHHHHRHEYYPVYQERVYVPQPVVEYYAPPPRYYAPPPPPPPVRAYSYDQRSPQGLVGGMLGSAVGYEMGQGDRLASGIGADAGALICKL